MQYLGVLDMKRVELTKKQKQQLMSQQQKI